MTQQFATHLKHMQVAFTGFLGGMHSAYSMHPPPSPSSHVTTLAVRPSEVSVSIETPGCDEAAPLRLQPCRRRLRLRRGKFRGTFSRRIPPRIAPCPSQRPSSPTQRPPDDRRRREERVSGRRLHRCKGKQQLGPRTERGPVTPCKTFGDSTFTFNFGEARFGPLEAVVGVAAAAARVVAVVAAAAMSQFASRTDGGDGTFTFKFGEARVGTAEAVVGVAVTTTHFACGPAGGDTTAGAAAADTSGATIACTTAGAGHTISSQTCQSQHRPS